MQKEIHLFLFVIFLTHLTCVSHFRNFSHYQILLKENMKAAPDESHFFLNRVEILGHIIEVNTISPLKSQIGAILKLQLSSNKKI